MGEEMGEEMREFTRLLESLSPDEISFDDRWKLYLLYLDLLALLDQQGEG